MDRATVLSDERLTDAAKQLSDDKLALVYQDILKPLDFHSILNERRKQWQRSEEVYDMRALHDYVQ